MLRTQGLHIERVGKSLLSSVDLTLHPGEVLGVLGPNGAGKSTLLGALSGELKPTRGEVWLGHQALARWKSIERAQHLAVLPQTSSLDFAFQVHEVVAMGRLPHASGQRHDRQIIEAALQATDVGHLHNRSYPTLSGGERQRVHLARVLAQLWPAQPGKVLLLDEPTAALDPLHQHIALQAIRDVADQGVAVLVILHDLNLAARYCDRMLLLRSGHIQFAGTPTEVLQPQALRSVFGIEVLVQAHPERGHPMVIAR